MNGWKRTATITAVIVAVIAILAFLGWDRPPYAKWGEHTAFVSAAMQTHDKLSTTIKEVSEQVAGNSKAILRANRDAAERALRAQERRIRKLTSQRRDTKDAENYRDVLKRQLRDANEDLSDKRRRR